VAEGKGGEGRHAGRGIWWKVTKETRGGHLISPTVPIATDSNREGCRTKIIKKMDHHTLIRGMCYGRYKICDPITIAIVLYNVALPKSLPTEEGSKLLPHHHKKIYYLYLYYYL
jgi:hypothetical protein